MDPAKQDLDTPRRLAAGALAGLTSVACTYPLDIIRTRLSVQSAQMAKSKEVQAKLPGIWQTMVHIYTKEGGVVGLYRGLGPTLTVSTDPSYGQSSQLQSSLATILIPLWVWL